MEKNFDIAVACRIYPGVSKTPIIFPADKYALVKTSLLSFKKSLAGLKISYYFLLDGCPAKYRELINMIFAGDKIIIIETAAIGNMQTFKKQVETLSTQTDSDLIFFAEDDYLYEPGKFKLMVDLITSGNADFVSPYLHNDVFTHPIHRHKRYVKFECNHFWVEASSTCLTFLTTKKILLETKNLFLTYCKGNNDCSIWLVLTKRHILNPFSYIRFIGNKECFGILKIAVKRSFKYFFNNRKYNLLMPYPAIATHLETGLESPGTDWLKLADEIEKEDSLVN